MYDIEKFLLLWIDIDLIYVTEWQNSTLANPALCIVISHLADTSFTQN